MLIRIRWYYETIPAPLVLTHGYGRGVRRRDPQGRAHNAREVLTKRPAYTAARCFLAR